MMLCLGVQQNSVDRPQNSQRRRLCKPVVGERQTKKTIHDREEKKNISYDLSLLLIIILYVIIIYKYII